MQTKRTHPQFFLLATLAAAATAASAEIAPAACAAVQTQAQDPDRALAVSGHDHQGHRLRLLHGDVGDAHEYFSTGAGKCGISAETRSGEIVLHRR